MVANIQNHALCVQYVNSIPNNPQAYLMCLHPPMGNPNNAEQITTTLGLAVPKEKYCGLCKMVLLQE